MPLLAKGLDEIGPRFLVVLDYQQSHDGNIRVLPPEPKGRDWRLTGLSPVWAEGRGVLNPKILLGACGARVYRPFFVARGLPVPRRDCFARGAMRPAFSKKDGVRQRRWPIPSNSSRTCAPRPRRSSGRRAAKRWSPARW